MIDLKAFAEALTKSSIPAGFNDYNAIRVGSEVITIEGSMAKSGRVDFRFKSVGEFIDMLSSERLLRINGSQRRQILNHYYNILKNKPLKTELK